MDLSLKLKLAGHTCRFVFVRGKTSPDLVAEAARQETDAEITSLNEPCEDLAGLNPISSVTQMALYGKCAADGVWGRGPWESELSLVHEKVKSAVEEANSNDKLRYTVAARLF